MTEPKLKILCIEDDADTCELITFVFNDTGYETVSCSQVDCLKLIHEESFQAFILDNNFVGISGIEICREIRDFDRTTPIIFLSGDVREEEMEKAIAMGANAYLTKPNDFERLVPTVIKLIEHSLT
jgi:two-component system alkaline phosphatase synthesis response regulator PhoP